jgi:hypothetical protein
VGRKITVYSYWTWIPGEGLGSIAPAKRIRPEIEAMGGLAILFSGEEVDEDDLCRDGGYYPVKQCGQALEQV